MRKSEISFPHPLLSEYSKDYSDDCTFGIDLGDIQEINGEFIFPFTYTITSSGLKDMIEKCHAAVVIRVHCPAASFRKVFKFDGNSFININIPKSSIAKRLEFQGAIVAAMDYKEFKLPEHNQQFFEGTVIGLKRGDVLAETESIQVNIDDSELEKQLSSIILIDSVPGLECLDVNYDDDEDGLIHIRMPENEYQEYYTLRKNFKRYGISRFLQSAVIMPSLTEAIQLLRVEAIQKELDPEFEEKYSTTVWADSIIEKCDELQKDVYDDNVSAYALANEILRFVTKDAVSELHKKAQEMYNNNGATRMGGVD